MQVYQMNDPMLQKQFQKNLRMTTNPTRSRDSIAAARMVLQQNKKILDQMKANGTFTGT